jgi:hypothetical protein
VTPGGQWVAGEEGEAVSTERGDNEKGRELRGGAVQR